MKACIVLILLITSSVLQAVGNNPLVLRNEAITAMFDSSGLVSLHDTALDKAIELSGDAFRITVDGKTISSYKLKPTLITQMQHKVAFAYKEGDSVIKVEYELQPGWHFISKQLFYGTKKKEYRVDDITVITAELQNPVAGVQKISRGAHAVMLRLKDGADDKKDSTGLGMFVVLQNPFLKWSQNGKQISASYAPDMEWKKEYGLFASDKCCIGIYGLSGTRYPFQLVKEWDYIPEGSRSAIEEYIYAAEMDALADCVRAYLLFSNKKSVRAHIGWCENDYQIDVGTPEGQVEYKRIISMAGDIGCDNILFTPRNTKVSSPKENRDAWGWEEVLWLNLGQKIRKDEWDIAKEPLPETVKVLKEYAAKRDVSFMAYAYPAMKYRQNPEWMEWAGDDRGGYVCVDSGVRSFQDWFIDKLVLFAKTYDVNGFSFDHWWIAYEGKATSKYSQWYGCRRILESLRKKMPDIVIDGRQQYHWFGPWTWLAGSYPHPMMSDEQPGSFKAFPDLHTDRVSGDRTRYINYMLRVNQYTPIELIPGFMTHQTQRNDRKGKRRYDGFRAKDWDVLGWKYSLISSIGTAPMNHVINMIPARDEQEFKAFSAADKRWFKDWMDWTDKNMDTLRNLRPIIGQPMLGRVDGTAAIKDEKGFVFLFNPNYRAIPAKFVLDGSIGLTAGTTFVLKEMYPGTDRLIGKPGAGVWSYGDRVTVPMEGTRAMVLALEAVEEPIKKPLLFNVTGTVALKDDTLVLKDVRGEVGELEKVYVCLPADTQVKTVTVNGKKLPFKQNGSVVGVGVRFAGKQFSHSQQIGTYDPAFDGKTYTGSITIPKRIFSQLEARKKSWPVTYTEDDLEASWLGPYRLLLSIHIADVVDSMEVSLKIDGKPVKVKKSYNSIYGQGSKRTFMGFYADVADLKPGVKHTFEVSLPDLKPGQFQGLYFDNVETEYTEKIK